MSVVLCDLTYTSHSVVSISACCFCYYIYNTPCSLHLTVMSGDFIFKNLYNFSVFALFCCVLAN